MPVTRTDLLSFARGDIFLDTLQVLAMAFFFFFFESLDLRATSKSTTKTHGWVKPPVYWGGASGVKYLGSG